MQQQTIQTSTAAADADVWLNTAEVRRRCGGISDMTLFRWRASKTLGFPKPKRVCRILYWSAAELADWQARQEAPDASVS